MPPLNLCHMTFNWDSQDSKEALDHRYFSYFNVYTKAIHAHTYRTFTKPIIKGPSMSQFVSFYNYIKKKNTCLVYDMLAQSFMQMCYLVLMKSLHKLLFDWIRSKFFKKGQTLSGPILDDNKLVTVTQITRSNERSKFFQ